MIATVTINSDPRSSEATAIAIATAQCEKELGHVTAVTNVEDGKGRFGAEYVIEVRYQDEKGTWQASYGVGNGIAQCWVS